MPAPRMPDEQILLLVAAQVRGRVSSDEPLSPEFLPGEVYDLRVRAEKAEETARAQAAELQALREVAEAAKGWRAADDAADALFRDQACPPAADSAAISTRLMRAMAAMRAALTKLEEVSRG